jgi:hypothetical protein
MVNPAGEQKGRNMDSSTQSKKTIPTPVSASPQPIAGSLTPNNSPVLVAIGNKSVQAGSALNLSISAVNSNAEPLAFSASDLPAGAGFNFVWTPTPDQVGNYLVIFNVSNPRGGTASETITISVTPAPAMSPAPAALSNFWAGVIHQGPLGPGVTQYAVGLTFVLTAPVASDTVVSLTVAPIIPGLFPESVTIPAGTTNYVFTCVAPLNLHGTFTLTASVEGVSRTSTLILP